MEILVTVKKIKADRFKVIAMEQSGNYKLGDVVKEITYDELVKLPVKDISHIPIFKIQV